MNIHTQQQIHRLWDELSDFDTGQSEAAAAHLMAALAEQAHSWNASWAGAIRMDAPLGNDPLLGWRVASLQALNPVSPDPDARHLKEILRIWDRREIDPSFLLPMRGLGTFRTYSLRRDLPPEWFQSEFYDRHYRSVGNYDVVFVAFPLNQDCESHFAFYSGTPFTDEDIALLTYALRGIKWFHRSLMMANGLLIASVPLTATERRVLQRLLTGMAEKQIASQMDIATSTVHQHVMRIFRKFGVRSRAALMSLWLNRAG
jgi:DNA-binding CsgD family transcriptional regulator